MGKKQAWSVCLFLFSLVFRFDLCQLQERGQLPESHEDWESEAGLHLPYNPHQMAMKKRVIRQPLRGAARSERKMFIAAERKRHADLGLEEEKKCLGQELK